MQKSFVPALFLRPNWLFYYINYKFGVFFNLYINLVFFGEEIYMIFFFFFVSVLSQNSQNRPIIPQNRSFFRHF
jgi:hypothetical protein